LYARVYFKGKKECMNHELHLTQHLNYTQLIINVCYEYCIK